MSPAVLSAPAELTRFAALRSRDDGNGPCVFDLMHRRDATQSRVSWHIQAVKQARRVVDGRDARWVRCRIGPGLPPHLRALPAAVFVEQVMA